MHRTARLVVGIAIAVSIVHYLDNSINYADYPQAASLPDPPRGLVAASWFAFTAAALLGLWWLREGRTRAAAIALAIYSGSGLVGFGHYAAAGATSMPWWRQAHIVADILCGLLVLAVALALVRTPSSSSGELSRT